MPASLTVRVATRSSRSRVCGRCGDGVKVSLTAPPVDGKANRELSALLAKWLGVAKSNVVIAAGERGRSKRVEIEAISQETLSEALSSLPDVS